MFGLFNSIDTIETIGTFGSPDVLHTFNQLDIPGTIMSVNLFGLDIQSPTEWAFDKLQEHVMEFLLGYIQVFPIVLGVAAAVYVLIGLFSKTLAKLGVLGVILYSILVYLAA